MRWQHLSSISCWSRNADKQMLLEFGQHGNKVGWDVALQKFYGIRNVNQLQSDWQRWLAQ